MRLSSQTPYAANRDYLEDEFAILRLQLTREVLRQRTQAKPRQIDQLQGLVLNEEEILGILSAGLERSEDLIQDSEIKNKLTKLEEKVQTRKANHGNGAWLNQVHLAQTFQLSGAEELCLVLCLLTEIDPRYGKVFAFLHDDVSHRHPSPWLALRLFFDGIENQIPAREMFSPSAPLLKHRMVHFVEPSTASPLASRYLKLDDRIASYLLGLQVVDERLADWVELVPAGPDSMRTSAPDHILACTVHLAETSFGRGRAHARPILHLYGPSGSGRRSLAKHVCQRLQLPLLVADARRIPGSGTEQAELLWRLGRESLLQPCAIFLEHFDELLAEDRRVELAAFLQSALSFAPLTFLSGSATWRGDDAFSNRLFVTIGFPVPDAGARVKLWSEYLSGVPNHINSQELGELAAKFHLTNGQIRSAVGAALSRTAWETQSGGTVSAAELSLACRNVATPKLRDLAQKIEPIYGWPDIVLPDNQVGQLREVVAHVKQAQKVLESWGFAQKLPYGRGVGALFEGGSGTGKTMAAQIIAGDLELDLFKIDLSAVVSKYIGETEKNLSRVFTEAQNSNAILFFDEADALFAKRSEMTKGDAHDRYANIETAYLLQRMEEYSGVVILATNMKQNLDEAFMRRLRFIIHFPFPDEAQRQRIWEQVFPQQAPMNGDVDFRWLGRKLKITGGNIRSISVRAAYLAAERNCDIHMGCVLEAAKRELEKFRKTCAPAESAARFTEPAPSTEEEAA